MIPIQKQRAIPMKDIPACISCNFSQICHHMRELQTNIISILCTFFMCHQNSKDRWKGTKRAENKSRCGEFPGFCLQQYTFLLIITGNARHSLKPSSNKTKQQSSDNQQKKDFFLMEMDFTILCKTRKCSLQLTLYAGNLFAITYASEAFSSN